MWEGDVLPPARSAKTEAIYDLIELKRAKFNSCVISAGIIGLKKQVLYNYVLTIWGGGSWAVRGGSSPLPPPVDRTLAGVLGGNEK